MLASEELLDDLAGAVLDGAAVDWAAAESTAEGAAKPLVRHLRLVASVAQLHREVLPPTATFSGPPAIAQEPAVRDRWGHLKLFERVGRGAYGEVFRAWDTRLDREVALKLLPAPQSAQSSAPSSIIREGRLLAKVRHPNVVTIHGAEQIGDEIGLWMEFVRGQTLDRLVKQNTAFRSPEAVTIGLELCRAVSAVHGAGLLHRDIKAQNVVRADDGRIVLMDFGTGRELDDNSASDLAGTPLYLAPEVLAGGPATVQSEIYSLGVLLYHLLTGSYPVRGRTIRDVRRAHQRNERVGLRSVRPDVRPALARVIERATDPEPQRRYTNVEALARDLSALQRRPVIVRLRNGLIAAAAVLAVALVATEVRARMSGDRRSLGTRVAGLFGVAPSYLDNPSIAVLPFRSASNDPDSVLLVDNVTAGLVRQLDSIDGLEVRSETSSFELKDKSLNLAEVGKSLDVNLLVEGDARLSNGLLTINAALVVITEDRRIWRGKVEHELKSHGDVTAIIDELTKKIVDKLRLKLGRTQRRYDTNMQTLEIYWRARELRDRRNDGNQAAALFDEVTRRDPLFAPAWAALAVTRADQARAYGGERLRPAPGGALSPGEAIALAEPIARQALELDPTLAEAHAALGKIHSLRLRWADAEKAFQYAIFLEPTLTALYGDLAIDVLLPMGRAEEAVALMEEAVRVSPLSASAHRALARAQLFADKYDDALDSCRWVSAHAPDYPWEPEICGLAWVFTGQTDKALEIFNAYGGERFIPWVDARTGRRAEAEAGAATFVKNPRISAMIFTALGDMDRAFEALERLEILQPRRAAYYFFSPELSALRNHPRAAAFRQRLGLPR